MSNSLLEKIKADAAARVAEIEAEATATAEAHRAHAARALEVLRTEAAVVLQKEKAQRTLVAESKAKQAHKLAVQTAKRAAIDAVFTAAFQQLAEQSTAEYVAEYTERWQTAVPKDTTVTHITAPAKRQPETESILSSIGITCTPVYNDKLTAGMIVATDSGVYDLTLDRRFAEARPELEMAVVAAVS